MFRKPVSGMYGPLLSSPILSNVGIIFNPLRAEICKAGLSWDEVWDLKSVRKGYSLIGACHFMRRGMGSRTTPPPKDKKQNNNNKTKQNKQKTNVTNKPGKRYIVSVFLNMHVKK